MKTSTRWLFGLALALIMVIVSIAVLAWHSAIEPVAPVARIDRALEIRGAALAALGNCASCHTPIDGVPYAGGVPLETPFGTIHSANLTPDEATGIGRWSLPAFTRAMRDGVSRDGHLLYPAFPYDHFRGTTDDDRSALYAYLMSRDAALSTPPSNRLIPPLQWRPAIAVWNVLFLRDESEPPLVSNDHVAARGRFLVDTLGHCGGCHTPRNLLGAEKRSRPLDGAVIDGWYAPPLDARTPSPVRWTVPAMREYLRTGLTADHAIAAGPMQTVVGNLAQADEGDVLALATAVVATMNGTPADPTRENASRERASRPLAGRVAGRTIDRTTDRTDDRADANLALGASVYASACAECHDRGRQVSSNSGLQLPLAVALYEEEPLSLLRVIREGIVPPDGRRGRWMPAFGQTLSDDQLVALLAYLRHVAADQAPWPRLAHAVARTGRGPETPPSEQ